MAIQTCRYCGGRFRRLDRHLAGRRGCALAARASRDAGRRVPDPNVPAVAFGGDLAGAEARPLPPTPDDLGPAGRRLWSAVTEVFILDPHTLATLESAARELDRAHAAEAVLAQAGEFVTDRYGSPKQHPAVQVARASRLAAARLVQTLALPSKES